jgi:hypothetical protein
VGSFEELAGALIDRDDVSIGGRGFGSTALKVDGRIFAMSGDAGLVLKLPRDRVARLVAAGDGLPFDAGKGTPLQEWVVIPTSAEGTWRDLAEEARAFVGARRRG